MGGCCSQTNLQMKQLDRVIAAELFEEKNRRKCERRVLFFGPAKAGKSTLFNQLRVIYGNGFDQELRLQIKPKIYKYIIQSMQQILQCIEHYRHFSLSETVNECANVIININVNNFEAEFEDFNDIINYINILVTQQTIKHIIKNASTYLIDDSCGYFFDKISEINDCKEYLPSDEDIIHFRNKNEHGVNETHLQVKGDLITFIDIDYNRNVDYKKWIHCFEYIQTLIFVASLNCYDERINFVDGEDISYSDKLKWKQFWHNLQNITGKDVANLIMEFTGIYENAMMKQINFFAEICNNEWFIKMPMILLLNKKDLFDKKISNATNESFFECFPKYDGDYTYTNCVKYIEQQFTLEFRQCEKRELFCHIVESTDRNLVERIFSDIQLIVISQALSEGGYMDFDEE